MRSEAHITAEQRERLQEVNAVVMATELVPEDEWLPFAACGPEDADLFYSDDKLENHMAKTICSRCIVHLNCLKYVIESDQEIHGVWGGYTQVELRQLKRINRGFKANAVVATESAEQAS